MIDQRDALQRPEVVRVRPKPEGHGLPLPPLLPIVAMVFLFGGIAIGYRLGPTNPAPTPSRMASAPAGPSMSAYRPDRSVMKPILIVSPEI